jgi:hypothetical protein
LATTSRTVNKRQLSKERRALVAELQEQEHVQLFNVNSIPFIKSKQASAQREREFNLKTPKQKEQA